MTYEPLNIIALLIGGLMAGTVNSLAGGGSLLTLPILVFVGLPPVVANGTNRIAIFAQSITATVAFSRSGKVPWGAVPRTLVPVLFGAFIGASVAVRLPNELFKPILGVLLLLLGGLLLVDPKRWLKPEGQGLTAGLLALAWVGVGLHGGFIQAGVGFTCLAVAVLGAGFDLVRANALKMVANGCLTTLALVIFAWDGQVDWIAGGILAIGNGLGGWIGAKLAIDKGATLIRWAMVVMVAASAVKILFF